MLSLMLNISYMIKWIFELLQNCLKNSLNLSHLALTLSSTFQVIAILFDRLVLKLFQYTLKTFKMGNISPYVTLVIFMVIHSRWCRALKVIWKIWRILEHASDSKTLGCINVMLDFSLDLFWKFYLFLKMCLKLKSMHLTLPIDTTPKLCSCNPKELIRCKINAY